MFKFLRSNTPQTPPPVNPNVLTTGTGTGTQGTTGTTHHTPAIPLLPMGQNSGNHAAGGTLRPRAAALPAAVAVALTDAHNAHAAVPVRVDQQAPVAAVHTAREQSMQQLQKRGDHALREVDNKLTALDADIAAARTAVGDAHTRVQQQQAEVTRRQGALDQATTDRGPLHQAVLDARAAPALAAARERVIDLEADLGAPPAAGASSGDPAAQRRRLADQLRTARADLATQEGHVTTAEQALTAHDRLIQTRGEERDAARGDLTTATAAHTAAQGVETTVTQARAQMQGRRDALTTVQTANLAPMTAHANAARTALNDAAAASDAHRAVARAAADLAELTKTAETTRGAVNDKRGQVAELDRLNNEAHAEIATNSPLRTRIADLERQVQRLEQQAAAPSTSQAPARPAAPGPDPLQVARDARDEARAELRTKQQTALDTQAAADQGHAELQPMAQQLTQETAHVATAANTRDQRATAAATADRTAAASIVARDHLQPAADAAAGRIDHELTALSNALYTPRPAPENNPAQGPVSAMKKPLHALQNRMTPAKYDVTVGPFSASSSGTAPTRFHDGQTPAKTLTTATSPGQLKSVDKKVDVAADGASKLLAGGKGSAGQAAQAPAEFGTAVAFTSEVGRLFTPAAGATGAPEATPAATQLADALLRHPNPDPAGRPDGHPLRHEQALLIASVLRSVTENPADAAQVYHHLWNDPAPAIDGLTPAAGRGASPMAANPGDTAPSTGPNIQQLANAARRALASTSGGMQALLDLHGLTLPPAGTDVASRATRRHAEHGVEHYKLALRAESALLAQGLRVPQPQSADQIETEVRARAQGTQLLNADWLGTGNAKRAGGGRRQAEDPMTLASQAFLYAKANMTHATHADPAVSQYKPAYVALRNGFTESGQGSEFHLMTKRLHKFCKYIDLACASPAGTLPNMGDAFKHPIRSTVTGTRRKLGKDKTPLKTLMQSGPLGSNLGTVPGEHAKRLTTALATGQRLMRNDLTANFATLGEADRTRALMRLAAMEQWAAKVPGGADPMIDLSQGTRVPDAGVRARAEALNRELGGPNAAPLHAATVQAESQAQQARPLLPDTLQGWVGEGRLASSTGPKDTGAEMTALGDDLKILRGKASMDSAFEDLQRRFDAATPENRRDLLRQVMIQVVAGGDMTDYSDGRKNGVGGMFGYGVARFEGLGGLTTGVTPVGEFNVDHTRTAVLKAGVASNTGVIFLGNERKVNEMLGGGVRLGAEAGPVVNLTGQAMARIGGSHLFSQGLMMRTNKQGTEHETLNDAQKARLTAPVDSWKRMSELTVNSVFDIAAQPKPPKGTAPGAAPPGSRPMNGGEMWTQMVGKVGDFRDISFGWNTGQSHQITGSVGVDGTVAAKMGAGTSFSVTGGAGIKHTFLNRNKAKDTAGATQTVQAGSGSRTSIGMAASAGISHPTIKNPANPDIGLFARHKVGVETELVIQAKNGFVRITTEDGKVKPNISYKHREFAVEEDFVKLVNGQRAQWEPRLGERTTDGRLRDGDRVLDGFLQQMADLPPGNNRLFIERKCLTQDAADTINACMERMAVLQRQQPAGTPPDPGAAEQIQHLKEQIAAQVGQEANWQPFRLFVNETNQRSKESSVGGEVRASPNKIDDKEAGPTGFAERFLGGGKVTLGGKVNTAHGGRDLITLDAQPVQA
ncbi:hypothetical protein [Mitsuaria sp. GD03876]|uniref:hypothetical protein n=1 Tax=Mitsuaria sp. GD03876 TaxID=2975399 RepID=UPI002449FDF2|nr:hypothetical protein [Mitsuaria sp. GD03876]MDH0866046.1 hypothetical protein [Mitsuaria sp. GD03876]